MESFDRVEDKIKCREGIHYLLLKLTDIIVLPDIFHRHFNIPDNLDDFINLNLIAHNNDAHTDHDYDIHPDSLLACKLSALNITNRFIGTTFLCCIYCSIFVDGHNYQFSGVKQIVEKTGIRYIVN
jgi:hypothetical protein